MLHVGLDQVSSSESAAKTEFASKDATRYNAGELASIVSGVCGMRTSYP